MLFKILVIIAIISIGFLISTSSLGGGGFISTFLVAFGLFTVIALVGIIMLAKKNKPKK